MQKYTALVKGAHGEFQICSVSFRNAQLDIEPEKDNEINLTIDSETIALVDKSRTIGVEGKSNDLALPKRLSISLLPSIITKRSYSPEAREILEDVFPPSTNGFYGRMGKEGEEAVFSVHTIEESEMFWLFISNSKTGLVYEAYAIQPYECGVLKFVEDWKTDKEKGILQKPDDSDSLLNMIEKVLNGHPPSWQQIRLILGDIVVPNFFRGNTMEETITQLVPKSFPTDIRNQLVTFLALILTVDIPEEDPVEYFSGFYSQPILRALLMGHLQFVLDKREWPPYVKLMILAERDQLSAPKGPIPEKARSSWIILWLKLLELFPDWRNIAIERAKAMNTSKSVILRLPITKSAAKRSKHAWRERMALMVSDLALRVNVNPRILGLKQIFYLGAAYRWPHNHMSWIARLGEVADQPHHLQTMIMPPAALARMKRFTPGIREVSMSFQVSNLEKYLNDELKWSMETSPILKSVSRKSSPKKLQSNFGRAAKTLAYNVDKVEASVLDLASRTSALSVVETLDTETYWGFSKTTMKKVLEKMHNLGIIDYYYEIRYHDLVPIFILAEGEITSICSLANSFLKEAPSASVMLSEESESCMTIARVPEDSVYTLASKLPTLARDSGLQLRIMRPRAIRTYTHNLYQRLLRDDGTWDDDVSAFLSQARSKRKELSKSNA